MSLGILTMRIYIPGCNSLKEKRSRLKPLINRLHREFNISVAEIDHQDTWNQAMIACAVVSNDHSFTQSILQSVVKWVETQWPDVDITDETIELI